MLGILCGCLAVVIVMWGQFARRGRLRSLWGRSCGGREWLRAFPEAGKEDIREFLRLFAEAFCFRRKHALVFRPTDRIMDVYRTVYPSQWSLGDMLELEHLAISLERRYGFALRSVMSEELTLGEVFGLVGGV